MRQDLPSEPSTPQAGSKRGKPPLTFYFFSLDRRTRSPPPNRVRAPTADAGLISGTTGKSASHGANRRSGDHEQHCKRSIHVFSHKPLKTGRKMLYFFRRARSTRIEPPSSVSAPTADAGLISGALGATAARAFPDAVASTSINAIAVFTSSPLSHSK